MSIAFLISFWLPMPKRSMFFKEEKTVGLQSQRGGPHKDSSSEESGMDKDGASLEEAKMEHDGSGCCSRKNVATAGRLLWQSFRESYSSRHFLFSCILLMTNICSVYTTKLLNRINTHCGIFLQITQVVVGDLKPSSQSVHLAGI